MTEPLVINGVRYCRACVRKLGGDLVKADSQPAVFNVHSGIRHLNANASDKASFTTLCGLDTGNQNWQEPWRVMERRREREHRRWHREWAKTREQTRELLGKR